MLNNITPELNICCEKCTCKTLLKDVKHVKKHRWVLYCECDGWAERGSTYVTKNFSNSKWKFTNSVTNDFFVPKDCPFTLEHLLADKNQVK